MKWLPWTVVALASAALLAACGSEEALKVGDPAPDFTLSSTAGDVVSMQEYRDGGPVLLYFHMAVG